MQSIDRVVLQSVFEWLLTGHHVLLVTVLRTWGSSPRPIGALMAIRGDGRVVGSVSGGCIEDDLIKRYTQQGDFSSKSIPFPLVQVYGIKAEEAHQFGLPCGGTIELLIEKNLNVNSFEQIIKVVDSGGFISRKVNILTGEELLNKALSPMDFYFDGLWAQQGFGPGYKMLLIGAGQLSEYLATMALFNDFEVTVCDPRNHYLSSWSLDGVKLVRGMPDDEVISFRLNGRSCVVALTHDPKLDDLALLEALGSPAFYVGAIGSRNNSKARRERMIQYLDQTEESLRALRSPVGIYIGSKTPSEIAVSIMADIIASKNKIKIPDCFDIAKAKSNKDK